MNQQEDYDDIDLPVTAKWVYHVLIAIGVAIVYAGILVVMIILFISGVG